jgi:hypothetical protein
MNVLAIGYRVHDQLLFGLPPRPPLNLDPVYLVDDPAEVRTLSDDLGYLRLILRATNNLPVEQLLVAHIRNVVELRGGDEAWAMAAVRELIALLRSNYDILIPTLEALSNALPGLALEVTR